MQRGSCLTSCGLNTGGKWSVLAQPGKGTESLIDRGALRALPPMLAKHLSSAPNQVAAFFPQNADCMSLSGVEAYPPPGLCNAHT